GRLFGQEGGCGLHGKKFSCKLGGDFEGGGLNSYDPWLALKFDDTAWCRDVIKTRVKAMDVLACSGAAHWWIEVKDCLGFEPANQPRLSPNDPAAVAAVREWAQAQGHRDAVFVKRAKPFVVDEVAEKLEGTLVSLAAAVRADPPHADAAEVLRFALVMDASAQWSVVLLLTWNPAARDFGRLAMRLGDKLRQRLAAYNVQCFVLNERESAPNQPWTLTRAEP
ncbi:MAG: hypothetical protein RLZZ352_2775, partial [Pseudomonadota bacterium]